MAGAYPPGPSFTRPTLRIEVSRSESVARLPKPGCRVWLTMIASWSHPWAWSSLSAIAAGSVSSAQVLSRHQETRSRSGW